MSRVSAGSRAFRDNVPLLRPGDESANRAGSYAMSDLVQKLRARNAYLSLDEAADRIDALRSRLAEARANAFQDALDCMRDRQARDHLAACLQDKYGVWWKTDSATRRENEHE